MVQKKRGDASTGVWGRRRCDTSWRKIGCKRGTDYRERGKALRPVQEPFLPAYFENVGEAELDGGTDSIQA